MVEYLYHLSPARCQEQPLPSETYYHESLTSRQMSREGWLEQSLLIRTTGLGPLCLPALGSNLWVFTRTGSSMGTHCTCVCVCVCLFRGGPSVLCFSPSSVAPVFLLPLRVRALTWATLIFWLCSCDLRPNPSPLFAHL